MPQRCELRRGAEVCARQNLERAGGVEVVKGWIPLGKRHGAAEMGAEGLVDLEELDMVLLRELDWVTFLVVGLGEAQAR